jgi:hypothetical protein
MVPPEKSFTNRKRKRRRRGGQHCRLTPGFGALLTWALSLVFSSDLFGTKRSKSFASQHKV